MSANITEFESWTAALDYKARILYAQIARLQSEVAESGGSDDLLEELTAQGLAPKLVQDMLRSVTRMKEEGVAVLLVEQHALAALDVTDRAYVLDNGRVVHEGASQELRDDAELRQRLLGG
jgi:ABC-type lipopolysaccharide export system ATPase subunit